MAMQIILVSLFFDCGFEFAFIIQVQMLKV